MLPNCTYTITTKATSKLPYLGRAPADLITALFVTCCDVLQGSYLTLGMVRTPEQWIWAGSVLGGGAALAGAYYLYTASTDANKRKQYRRAFDEVSKYN